MSRIIFIALFFLVPAVLVVLFAVSLFMYLSARNKARQNPGSVSPDELSRRKILLIAASVAAGLAVAVVIGIVALLFAAVAFM